MIPAGALVLGLALALAAATPGDSNGAAVARREAAALLADAEFGRAADVLRAALDASPGDPELHYLLALALRDGAPMDLPAAAAELREVLELDPSHPEAAPVLAEILERTGRLPEAEGVLRRRLEQAPGDARAAARLGVTLQARGEAEAGVAWLERAAALAGDDPRTLVDLGRGYLRAGRAARAIEALERARAADPGILDGRYSLALAYRAAGRQALAEEELAAYRELLRAWEERQRRARDREGARRAMARLEAEIAARPAAPWPDYAALAARYADASAWERGDAFFAARAAAAAAAAAPWLGRAYLAQQRGEEDLAWEHLRQAAAREPAHPEALAWAVSMATDPARTQEARRWMERARSEPAPPPELPLWTGRLALAAGDLAAAESALGTAVTALPQDPAPRLHLGLVYARSRRMVQAMEMFRAVTAEHPGVPEGWANLAAAERSLGLTEAAAAHLEEGLRRAGDSPLLLNPLAVVREGAGDRAAAAALLRRSLDLDPGQPEVRRRLQRLESPGG